MRFFVAITIAAAVAQQANSVNLNSLAGASSSAEKIDFGKMAGGLANGVSAVGSGDWGALTTAGLSTAASATPGVAGQILDTSAANAGQAVNAGINHDYQGLIHSTGDTANQVQTVVKTTKANKSASPAGTVAVVPNQVQQVAADGSASPVSTVAVVPNQVQQVAADGSASPVSTVAVVPNQVQQVAADGSASPVSTVAVVPNQVQQVAADGSASPVSTVAVVPNQVQQVAADSSTVQPAGTVAVVPNQVQQVAATNVASQLPTGTVVNTEGVSQSLVPAGSQESVLPVANIPGATQIISLV